jgi:hypothetical protein
MPRLSPRVIALRALKSLVTIFCPPFENFFPRNMFGVKQAFFDWTSEKYTSGLFSTPTNSD